MKKKYGKLTPIKFIYYKKQSNRKREVWLFKCDCGEYKKTFLAYVTRKKGINQCDKCHLKDKTNRAIIHGESRTRFYKIWHQMKLRCNNKNDKTHWKNYGGRGITYDPRWENYKNFKRDMWYSYTKTKLCLKIKQPTIERVNVNGNYCKSNCIWIPMNKQQGNRTTVKTFKAVSPEGRVYITRNAAEFARNFFGDVMQRHQINKCLRGERKYFQWWTFEYV